MAGAKGVVASVSLGEDRIGATDYWPALQQQQHWKPPKRGAAAVATTQQQIKDLHNCVNLLRNTLTERCPGQCSVKFGKF